MAISAPVFRAPSVASAVGLVVANLVPLAGVLWFGWSLFGVMWLYWAENGIIGFYALLRILSAGDTEGAASKLFMGPFFVVHYGLFWLVHGGFVVSLFGEDGRGPLTGFYTDVPVEGLVALFLSHGTSFVLNYLGRGEWRAAMPMVEMFKPYGRVVLLHVVLITGGFLVDSAGAGVLALALLVGLKTALDLGVHLIGHRWREKDLGLAEADPAATTLHVQAPPHRAGADAVPLTLPEDER